jgi:CRISPR-associated protein Csm4
LRGKCLTYIGTEGIVNEPSLLGKTIDELLKDYGTQPFAVFSSMLPKFMIDSAYVYAFNTPSIPLENLFNIPNSKEGMKKRKDFKRKRWLLVSDVQRISLLAKDRASLNIIEDRELFSKYVESLSNESKKEMRRIGTTSVITSFDQYHNNISRLTGTTGEGEFAPFAVEQTVYYPEMELALFVGIADTIDIAQVIKGIKNIGLIGFGKDAPTGLGRFDVGDCKKINLSAIDGERPNACYSLAPCVPQKDTFSKVFFEPFTRFGKHGDTLYIKKSF